MRITLVIEGGAIVPVELTREQLDRVLERLDRPGVTIDLTVRVTDAELAAIRDELGR